VSEGEPCSDGRCATQPLGSPAAWTAGRRADVVAVLRWRGDVALTELVE
jgi:hypothetical protein